jgi:hypothetical protein
MATTMTFGNAVCVSGKLTSDLYTGNASIWVVRQGGGVLLKSSFSPALAKPEGTPDAAPDQEAIDLVPKIGVHTIEFNGTCRSVNIRSFT